jgi:integrase/recombinase XerD
LPDTLAIAEIDSLIAAIDLSSNEGERNRAMLETLYGWTASFGMVGLKISDLF